MEKEKFNKNKDKLKSEIGKKLKSKRQNLNKSLTNFCYEYQIPNSSMNYIERGIQDPSITTLWRILEAQNIKMSDFFRMIEEDLPENFTLLDF